MNDKKKLQEMLDRYKRYYVYHDFSAQFTEGDIDWLLGQAEILQKLEEKIIEVMEFVEKEMNMHDNDYLHDYLRGIYYAHKRMLEQIKQLED